MRAGAGRREGRIRAAASAALAAVALLIGAGPSPAAVAPEIVSGMQGITAGPDGALWFVATGIGRLTTDGAVTLFPVPAGDAQLFDLAVGADGNVWFTEFGGRVGRITPAGEVAMFPRGIPAPGPCDCLGGRIARGPDGNMWFTVPNGGWIGHVAPDGDYTIVAITPGRGAPEDIAAGPDGAMWFTDTAGNIGRITLGGDITLFGAGRLAPSEIAAGPDGNMWFTEPGRRRLGRITPAGVVTEFPTGRAGPLDITAGPDGNLWFSSLGGAWIGRMAPTGTLRLFPIGDDLGDGYFGIAAGPDGNLWFTETASPGRIGRITTDGVVTEFTTGLSTGAAPLGIVAGPDGAMWFTERLGSRIGRITVGPGVTVGVAGQVSREAATVTADVTPNGQASTVSIEYGPTTAYGSSTTAVAVGSGLSPQTVSIALSGLSAGTT